MERLIEPEVMDKPDQAKAYAEANFSKTDEKMLSKLDEYISSLGKVLDEESLIVDLGCGPGNITELLARKWNSSKVIGIDGSEEMLKIARKRKNKLEGFQEMKNLVYKHHNFLSSADFINSIEGAVDLLVSNSVLHHIHYPEKFWRAIKSFGKRGSVIFHKDLRRPCSIQAANVLQKKYQPNAPFILKRDYLASLHAAFTVDEVRIQLDRVGLYQLKVFEVDDRYLEVVGVL